MGIKYENVFDYLGEDYLKTEDRFNNRDINKTLNRPWDEDFFQWINDINAYDFAGYEQIEQVGVFALPAKIMSFSSSYTQMKDILGNATKTHNSALNEKEADEFIKFHKELYNYNPEKPHIKYIDKRIDKINQNISKVQNNEVTSVLQETPIESITSIPEVPVKEINNPTKIDIIINALNEGVNKYEKQKILLQEINNHVLTVEEFNTLYDNVKDRDDLNMHRNPHFDNFWHKKNTKSWRNSLEILRDTAYEVLVNEVEKANPTEKTQLLEQAKNLPLFHEHRNNSVFTGAWGRTSTVKKIEKLENKLKTDVLLLQ